MILPAVFLCLTVVLPPSTGQETAALSALSSSRAEQQKLIVDRHNALRRGVKPTASNMMKMEWCPAAAENAQNWANKCALRHSPPNLRRTNVQCGENLFMSSAPFSWSDVLQAWYNEEKNFEYGTGAKPKGAMFGHYTQMVWHNSYKIGCGFAFCFNTTYSYFYVCQYCPAGNLIGSMKTPYKEGEPCGDCPNACEDGLCTNPCKYQDLLGNCKNLKMLFGCSHSLVKKKCPASCKCTTQII
ncbi:cysteine-rich venom protein kaouthin-2-like [Zonotrichia leucophrys gambelii]|uniref:cysteine-rich venom protein kaouthin-2-like n=1 Tax=Zonotrichia leucophrys gambelii TaxID=257770 RepID=UPI0031405ACC